MIGPRLLAWAARWGLPPTAMAELVAAVVEPEVLPAPPRARHEAPRSEAAVQARARLHHSARGTLVWRNNVGAMQDESGRMVRYGLANETREENERVKSADLVGGEPRLITPQMVGGTILQFWSRECKPVGWTYTGRGREPAQLRWLLLLAAHGGDAAFTTMEGS